MRKPPPPRLSDQDPAQLIRVGGPVDAVCVSLRLFGDDLIPEEVTRLLGCSPTKVQRKGDVIPDARYHRVARTGSWMLNGGLPKTTEIEQQIVALLESVTNDMEVWRQIVAKYDADIFCGVFLNDSNRGFSLSPTVTSMLADRGLEIGFDIYGPPST